MLLLTDNETRKPSLSVWIKQYREIIDALETAGVADRIDEAEAYRLCEHLCEASRQILYRVGRISRRDVEELRDLFQQASDAVGDVEKRLSEDGATLAQGFAAHIRERVTLLADLLRE